MGLSVCACIFYYIFISYYDKHFFRVTATILNGDWAYITWDSSIFILEEKLVIRQPEQQIFMGQICNHACTTTNMR
jgi:hypothetical protein